MEVPKPKAKLGSTLLHFSNQLKMINSEYSSGDYFADPNFIWAINFNKLGPDPLFRGQGMESVQ
jgi:hypothetical protein